ncbi:MAG: hypothetical protein LBQ96_04850 [Fusobacteriaceae bacterium]|jgi:hypothetical protein|nr:hypothetical protein [Fusobacteriaceae bacterium]
MSWLAITITIVIILPAMIGCGIVTHYTKKGTKSRGKACGGCPHYCGFGLGCDGKPRKTKIEVDIYDLYYDDQY